jgi:hypothetical protein
VRRNQEEARASRSSCCRPAARRGGFGRQRHDVACVGEDSGEALRRWQSFRATRGAALEQELASGGVATAASGSAAAAAEKTEEGEGGILGSYPQL